MWNYAGFQVSNRDEGTEEAIVEDLEERVGGDVVARVFERVNGFVAVEEWEEVDGLVWARDIFSRVELDMAQVGEVEWVE